MVLFLFNFHTYIMVVNYSCRSYIDQILKEDEMNLTLKNFLSLFNSFMIGVILGTLFTTLYFLEIIDRLSK